MNRKHSTPVQTLYAPRQGVLQLLCNGLLHGSTRPLVSMLILLGAAGASATESCADNRVLEATYQLSQQPLVAKAGGQGEPVMAGQPQTRTLRLVRNDKQLVLHYVDAGVTELWEQTRNHRIHLTRYFDQYQRGIEYQPQEISQAFDWDTKSHLIAPALLASLQESGTQGSGCETHVFYQTANQSASQSAAARPIQLEWIPALQLPQRLQQQTSTAVLEWRLQALSYDRERIQADIQQLQGYQTTDYADVGDSESDPFLRKMIHLGFVEHGHTGFYDDQGHELTETHPHAQ